MTSTYNASTYGSSLINQLSVAAGKNAATIVDLTGKTAGMILCKILCGASAPTVATTFSLYRLPSQASGSAPITTLSAGPSSGATSISVVSATGISTKCAILVVSASTGLGELVTVTGVSGTTLTVNALVNSYSSGAYVFVMEQTASGGSIAPGSSWAASTEYSCSIYTPSFVTGAGALWGLVVVNGDGTNAVTVTANLDYDS
jgi:hypothetical protein